MDVDVSAARRMRPPQMLFGVRASQINSYEQQAQTAKRFEKDIFFNRVRESHITSDCLAGWLAGWLERLTIRGREIEAARRLHPEYSL